MFSLCKNKIYNIFNQNDHIKGMMEGDKSNMFVFSSFCYNLPQSVLFKRFLMTCF